MNATYLIYQNKHVPMLFKELSPEKRKIQAAKAAIKMVLGLEFEQYDVNSRQRHLTFARQCFSALMRNNTQFSFVYIGSLYKKQYDHSSVFNHCDNIADLEYIGNRDPKFKDWEQIKENFKLLIKW